MNQNLSKLLGQLRDVWAQLGPTQRLNVGAATFVLAAALAGLAFWSSRVDYSLLYGGLSDAEAAKVIAALDEAKVPYQTGSGGSVLVPSDKVYATRMQLAGRGIPSGDGVGFEIFDKANFGISDFVQRANYTRAIEGELARTISQIDEVQSARVMIVMPENRLLLDKDTFPTASVFVHVRGTSQLQAQSINSIRFLVANSVEGLKPNHVSVVDNLGNVLSENTEDDSLSGLTSSQLGARRSLEQYLAKKGQDMLDRVLGPGQAIVRVAAEINYDSLTRSDEKYDPDGQVIVTQTKDDQVTDSSTTANTTPAGITANTQASTNAAAGAPMNNTQNHTTTSTVQYDVGKTTSNLVQTAGGIKRLSASVSVAAVEQGTGDARKIVPRTPDQLDKLRSIVASAVGIDLSRGDTIALEELPFNHDFATEVTQELDQQQKRDFWWDLARNSAWPLMAVGVFLALLRLLHRTPVQDIPLGVPVGRLLAAHHANGHGNGNGNGNGNGRSPAMAGRLGDSFETPPGLVTVDVLNRLIKENPANMTQAIRDWMNKGQTTEHN